MRASTRSAYRVAVQRAQQFVEERIDDDVSPADVAAVASMSLHHFHRVYRGMTGESVMGFARRLRLERAARELRHSHRPITDIALDAHYSSHEAFTRAFSDAFGQPPSAYRADEGPAAAAVQCLEHVDPPTHVEVRSEPERRVVAMRHTGAYAGVSEVWDRLWQWHGQVVRSPAPMYALVPDDPEVTDESLLRYDACLQLPAEIEVGRQEVGDAPITQTVIPGGRYAVVEHVGSYADLHRSYLSLIGGWFPDSGHAIATEPVIEHYLNSPMDTPPEQLRTEIWVRIEERGWMR